MDKQILGISLKSAGPSGKHDCITKKEEIREGRMVNVYIHGRQKKRDFRHKYKGNYGSSEQTGQSRVETAKRIFHRD